MFFFLALVALALAGCLVRVAQRERRTVMRLVTTETSTTGFIRELYAAATDAAGAGAFSEHIELDGTAEAAPSGLLTSPLSGSPCVWHRHRVTERYLDVTRDSEGRRQESEQTRVTTDESSHDPFVLRDADGDITIIPTTDVLHATKTLTESRDAEQQTVTFSRIEYKVPVRAHDGEILGRSFEEWTLAPGTRIFVAGEAADRRGELAVTSARDSKNDLVISTRDEEDEVGAHRARLRRFKVWAGIMVALSAAALLYGLVRLF